MVMDEGTKAEGRGPRAEGFTRITYELEEMAGVTRLTIIYDLSGALNLSLLLSGGMEQNECLRRLAVGPQRFQVAAGDGLVVHQRVDMVAVSLRPQP